MRSVWMMGAAIAGFGVIACSSSSGGAPGNGDAGGGSPDAAHDAGGGSDAPAGTCNNPLPNYENGNGSVTYYTFSMGAAAVNCGFQVKAVNPDTVAWVSTGNGQYFGAMNTADYDTAASCGACVEVTRDGSRKVVITIVDQCPTPTNPKCTKGHIDLSEAAFTQIGSASEGYLGTGNGASTGVISWKYVPCPVTGDVSFLLKDPSNQYWNQILVEGHRYPIAKVEAYVNGAWAPGVRQSYNYWQIGNGNLGTAPYQVRATDVNGSVVSATLMLEGTDQSAGSQFPVCQ